MKMFFNLIILISFILNINCAPGDLDPSFGNQGLVTTHIIPGNFEGATSVVIQSDGKIVAGGFTTNISVFEGNFALIRYNTNGSLDTTFGNQGKAVTPQFTPNSSDQIRSIALDSQENIIAAGITGSPFIDPNGQVLVAKYNPDGSLDNTFGNDGRVLISELLAPYEVSEVPVVSPALVIQPDGKIVVASFALVNNIHHFAIARLNPDGSFDNSFGNNGIVISPNFAAGSNDDANGITLQQDGKIVVIGTTQLSNNTFHFALERLNQNGTLDQSLANSGQIIVPNFSNNSQDFGMDVKVQDNGNIILAGFSNNQFALTSYKEDGTLNTAFGNNGKTITPSFEPGSIDFLTEISLQPNDKIVAVGISITSTGPMFAVARYNANGTLDNTFGNNGQVLTSFGPDTFSFAFGVDIQPDGKIVVSGREAENFVNNFALARYFGTSVVVSVNITSPRNGSTIKTNTPVISGTASPGTTVNVQIDGKTIGTVNTVNGKWSIQVTNPLKNGTHTIVVTATDPEGNTATATSIFTVKAKIIPCDKTNNAFILAMREKFQLQNF